MRYSTIHNLIPLPSKNHDAANSNSSGNMTWGVICDGVSSSFQPQAGAKLACNTISKFFNSASSNPGLPIDYQEMFNTVGIELNNLASKLAGLEQTTGKSLYATTVITAFQQEENIQFSYCGNGAILEIRKEWFMLPNDIPTPWGINNYLNPHSKIVDGDNKLFKTLRATLNKSLNISPDIVSIKRYNQLNSYFLICSDGLYSSDEISTGWTEDSNDYVLFENPILLLFLTVLKEHQKKGPIVQQSFNDAFKKLLMEKKLQNDDISYVLFIPNS